MKKACKKCGEVKDINDYCLHPGFKKDGRESTCRICTRKRRRELYWMSDRDKKKKYKQLYDLKNKERINKYSKMYKQTERGRELTKACRARCKQWLKDDHKKRSNANNIIYHDIKRGVITRGLCSYQKGRCEGRIDAHHWDYDKPREIVWFCRKHHALVDKIKRKIDARKIAEMKLQ